MKLPAPMRWATCTEKPEAAATHSPQKSQVVVDTNPMAAASAPRLPTIAASMYCMMMYETWVTTAGMLSRAVSSNCCPGVMGLPSLMRESKPLVLSCFCLFIKIRSLLRQVDCYFRYSWKKCSIFSNGITERLSYRSTWLAPGMISNSLLSPVNFLNASSLK